MPLEINILGKNIPIYSFWGILGIIVALVVAFILVRKKKMDVFDFCLNTVFCLIGVWIGSKLMFIITSWDIVKAIFANYSTIDAITILLRGGYVFYGGLIGGIVALLISLRVQKQNVFDYFDIFAVVLPLGHAIGRIGCFMAGCCYGMQYDGPLSYVYTHSADMNTPIGVPLFPVQLVESVLLFMIFVAILIVHLKSKSNKTTTFIYFYAYAVIRFTLEFFRGDKIRGVYILSTSQWISLIAVIACTIFLVVTKIKTKKKALAQ